jgi:hypothetical protein
VDAYDLVYARLLERTGSTGRNGSWPCPAHDDSTPSLSVSRGNEGVVLHCHAGCTTADVLTALGLDAKDLFDNPRTNGTDVDRTYDYVDEAGQLLFQVVRKPGKEFRQRRPDGAGGWIWKLSDTRRVLYRLPQLLAAIQAGVTIFVVEGEKDADRVAADGCVATCNPHGAGKWRPVYNETLRGADVVIVADRDKAGRAHARDIARNLDGIAARIRVAEAAEGKDISDHLAAGRSINDLVLIDLNAPPDDTPQEPQRTPTSWAPVDLTDALAGADIPAPELWKRSDGTPLIYRARVHWFQGESESCKSWAAQIIAATELNAGNDVLYIDFEDDERGVVARLRTLGAAVDAIAAHLIYLRPDEALKDRQGRYTDGWLDFTPLLEATQYSLGIIDGVTEAMTTEGLELISNADIATWMRLLPKRIAATGTAVICIDHVTKAVDGRGRYAIGGQHKLAGVTGAAYLFTTLRPLARAAGTEPVEAAIDVSVTKDRPGYVRGRSPEGKVGTLAITAYPDGDISTVLDPPGRRDTADIALIGRILSFLDDYDGSSTNSIEKGVEGNAARIREALRGAKERNWIRIDQRGNGHYHYLTDEGRTKVPNT